MMRVSFWREPASPSAVATASSTRSATTMPATQHQRRHHSAGDGRAGDIHAARDPAADGYLGAADQEITISANQRSQISVVNPSPEPQRTGDLRVFKLDTGGRALAGSCFALVDGGGQVLALRCDADDGADNGVVLMEGIAPGSTPCARPAGPPPTTRPQPTSWSRSPKTRPLTSRS